MVDAPLILVVDDDHRITDALQLRLEMAGYSVVVGHDGADGLAAVVAHDPDAIITDVAMPGMDGATLIRRLSEIGLLERTPLIVLSAGIDDRRRREFTELGARYVLRKPFDGEALMQIVMTTVPLARQNATLPPIHERGGS